MPSLRRFGRGHAADGAKTRAGREPAAAARADARAERSCRAGVGRVRRALLRRCGLCRAGGSGSRCVGRSRRFHFHTDNIEAVDRIHTFYDDLNIDEVVSVEADISLQPSGKDALLEKLLDELPVTGLTQTPEGWYGRLNSNVHLSDLAANKNVRIQETGYGSVHLQFGDKADLVRLYASVLTQ